MWENQTYWKAKIGYMRWAAEGAFSIFKRVFGEHALSLQWENIIQEIRLTYTGMKKFVMV